MPYDYPDNVPDYVRNLPAGAQRICVDAFNATQERGGDEDQARMACWGAIKNVYEQQDDGSWMRKAKEGAMINLDEIDTLMKAYAAHNKIHSEYVDARFGARRKAQIQVDHETVVRLILALGGRHLPKGEALDDTLPEDLREAFKLRSVSGNLVLDEEGIRSKVQIIRIGTFYHPEYGKFTISEDHLDNMVNNFGTVRPVAPTEMVIDYEHMSVAEPPVKAEAAGWFKSLERIGDALFAAIEWTADAAKSIKEMKYRFISPEFNLHYKDKETGKDVGATLISAALTNRPFLEGMEPVALSEGVMLFAEISYTELEDSVRAAYGTQFGPREGEAYRRDWVCEVYEDYCVVDRNAAYFKLPYSIDDDGNVTFDKGSEIQVQRVYQPVAATENDLPDECFAYIEPGGEKDDDGRTVPRALRHLPYKGADGEVDLLHLRAALSRLPQTNLSTEAKAKAHTILMDDQTKLREELMEKELRELLGLAEGADIVKAVEALKTKSEGVDPNKLTELEGQVTAAEQRATNAEAKLATFEVDRLIEDAVTAGKLTPAMVDEAKAYALTDREGFTKSLEYATKIAPELGERGAGGGEDDTKLTEAELAISEKMGTKKEDLIKAKEGSK